MSEDRPKKLDLMEWMNPDGNNFCGSGMTMQEWSMANGIQRYRNSWVNQNRAEQDRRQHFLTEMVLEQRCVHEKWGTFLEGKWYVQSGICMDMAIRAIIEGDRGDMEMAARWSSAEGFIENFGERDSATAWGERYARFHELCDQAVTTWPTDEEKAQA